MCELAWIVCCLFLYLTPSCFDGELSGKFHFQFKNILWMLSIWRKSLRRSPIGKKVGVFNCRAISSQLCWPTASKFKNAHLFVSDLNIRPQDLLVNFHLGTRWMVSLVFWRRLGLSTTSAASNCYWIGPIASFFSNALWNRIGSS